MMINPYIFPIKGDLSRADAIVLYELAVSQKGYIFEFGSGGSTIFLGLSGNSVVSFEHDKGWIGRTKKNVERYSKELKVNTSVHFEHVDYEKEKDVWRKQIKDVINSYYNPPFLTLVDGKSGHRDRMLELALEYSTKNTYILFHDCRAGKHLKVIFDEVFKYKEKVESIHISYRNSNMALIKIGTMKKYENWNNTEKGNNRVDWDTDLTGFKNG